MKVGVFHSAAITSVLFCFHGWGFISGEICHFVVARSRKCLTVTSTIQLLLERSNYAFVWELVVVPKAANRYFHGAEVGETGELDGVGRDESERFP